MHFEAEPTTDIRRDNTDFVFWYEECVNREPSFEVVWCLGGSIKCVVIGSRV